MNGRPERLRAEAWRWWRLAQEDFHGAERSANDPELVPRLGCFWAEQATEMALKAVLVAEDVDPPKTHDLVDLADRCGDVAIVDLNRAKLRFVSEFAVAARYPADALDITEATLADLIAIADAVLDAAANALRRTVGADPTAGGS